MGTARQRRNHPRLPPTVSTRPDARARYIFARAVQRGLALPGALEALAPAGSWGLPFSPCWGQPHRGLGGTGSTGSRRATIDARFSVRGPQPKPPGILIVAIDQNSLAKLPRLPVSTAAVCRGHRSFACRRGSTDRIRHRVHPPDRRHRRRRADLSGGQRPADGVRLDGRSISSAVPRCSAGRALSDRSVHTLGRRR